MLWEAELATNPAAPKPLVLDTTYPDLPTVAVWHQPTHSWKLRKQGNSVLECIMWIPLIESGTLCVFCSAMSPPVQLRTTNSKQLWMVISGKELQHPTFHDACLARGLLQDDSEWERCLHDINIHASAAHMRDTFVTILCYNEMTDPLGLWEKFKEHMTADYLLRARQQQRELRDRLVPQLNEGQRSAYDPIITAALQP